MMSVQSTEPVVDYNSIHVFSPLSFEEKIQVNKLIADWTSLLSLRGLESAQKTALLAQYVNLATESNLNAPSVLIGFYMRCSIPPHSRMRNNKEFEAIWLNKLDRCQYDYFAGCSPAERFYLMNLGETWKRNAEAEQREANVELILKILKSSLTVHQVGQFFFRHEITEFGSFRLKEQVVEAQEQKLETERQRVENSRESDSILYHFSAEQIETITQYSAEQWGINYGELTQEIENKLKANPEAFSEEQKRAFEEVIRNPFTPSRVDPSEFLVSSHT